MTRIASHPVKLDWTKIKAMVFDLDNTLISSQLNFVWLREQIGCPPKRDLLDYIDELPHQQAQKAHQIVVDHELDDARHSELMPGAKALLNVLAREQHHVAIITRNCQAAAEQKLEQHGLTISPVISREHYAAKPSPDALNALLESWQLMPEELIYVGDYVHDLHTAINAKTPSCLVTNHPMHREFSAYASLTVNSLDQLIPYISKHQ